MSSIDTVQDRVFRLLPELNLLLCIEHKLCCSIDQYQSHLLQAHRIKGAAKRSICEWVSQHNLPSQHFVPENYGPPIDGLQILPGYHCLADGCDFLTTSLKAMTKHVSKEHGIRCAKSQLQLNAYKECHVQRLFQNRSGLFAVSLGVSTAQSIAPRTQSTSDALENLLPSLDPEEQFQAFLKDGKKYAETKATSDRDIHQINAAPKVGSELLPWLKNTGFETLLKGQELDSIRLAIDIPEKIEPDSTRLDRLLVLLAQVLDVVMHEVYGIVPVLQYPTLCMLNSLHSGSTATDPFGTMQNDTTFAAYCRCLLQLLCFTARVHREETSLKDICILGEGEKEQMEALLQALSACHDVCIPDLLVLDKLT